MLPHELVASVRRDYGFDLRQLVAGGDEELTRGAPSGLVLGDRERQDAEHVLDPLGSPDHDVLPRRVVAERLALELDLERRDSSMLDLRLGGLIPENAACKPSLARTCEDA